MTTWIRRAFGRPSAILVAVEQWKVEQADEDAGLPKEIGMAHQAQLAWVAINVGAACRDLELVVPPVFVTVVAGGYYSGSAISERGWYRVEYNRPETE